MRTLSYAATVRLSHMGLARFFGFSVSERLMLALVIGALCRHGSADGLKRDGTLITLPLKGDNE